MDLFGFNTSDIHVVNDKYRNKNMKNEMGRQQFFEDMSFNNQINKTDSEVKQQMLIESLTENLKYTNKSYNHARTFSESNKLLTKFKNKVISKYLTEMTFDGLVFDDYFLNQHKKNIKNNLSETFDTLLKENLLNDNNFSNSLLMEDAINELNKLCEEYFQYKDEVNIFSESTINQLLNEAKKSKELSDEISDTVKDKVEDTLKTEKKISKKKDDEKKKDEEEKKKEEEEAADSLDSDPDEEEGDVDDDSEQDEENNDENDGTEEDGEDSTDGEEEDQDSEDEGDSEYEDDEEETEDEENPDEENDQSGEEENYNDNDDESNEEEGLEDSSEEENPDGMSNDNSSNGLTLTVKTNGTSVSVTANKSESLEYLNLIGNRRFKSMKESKTLFRNLLENCISESVNILNESTNGFNHGNKSINMDMILAESLIQYTLLETMYTSKLFDLTSNQIKKINSELLFRNR